MAAKLKKTVFLGRATGYYWIRFDNVAFVAYWSNVINEWLIVGDWEGINDSDRVVVLSSQLLPPVQF